MNNRIDRVKKIVYWDDMREAELTRIWDEEIQIAWDKSDIDWKIKFVSCYVGVMDAIQGEKPILEEAPHPNMKDVMDDELVKKWEGIRSSYLELIEELEAERDAETPDE